MNNLKNSNSWQKTMYGDFSAKFHLDSLFIRQRAKKEVNFLIRILKLQKDHSILDVPCGTGRYSLIFALKGYSIVGLDINDVCLKQARQNCPQHEKYSDKKRQYVPIGLGQRKI